MTTWATLYVLCYDTISGGSTDDGVQQPSTARPDFGAQTQRPPYQTQRPPYQTQRPPYGYLLNHQHILAFCSLVVTYCISYYVRTHLASFRPPPSNQPVTLEILPERQTVPQGETATLSCQTQVSVCTLFHII